MNAASRKNAMSFYAVRNFGPNQKPNQSLESSKTETQSTEITRAACKQTSSQTLHWRCRHNSQNASTSLETETLSGHKDTVLTLSDGDSLYFLPGDTFWVFAVCYRRLTHSCAHWARRFQIKTSRGLEMPG